MRDLQRPSATMLRALFRMLPVGAPLLGAMLGACSTGDGDVASAPAVTTHAAPLVWGPQDRLLPSASRSADFFGEGLALRGDRALVAARGARKATVFVRSGQRWTEEATLAPDVEPRTSYTFGHALAIAPGLAVVGAPDERKPYPNGGSEAVGGRVYVFTRSGTSWTYATELAVTGLPSFEADDFGAAVATDGELVVVGSPGEPSAVYVHAKRGTALPHVQTLARPPEAHPSFGAPLALAADGRLAVASSGTDGQPGHIHLYARSGGSFVAGPVVDVREQGSPTTSVTGVCFTGSTLVVATTAEGERASHLHIFEATPGGFAQAQELETARGELACDDRRIVASAFHRVEVLVRGADGRFAREAELTGEALFGASVGVHGDTVMVGAPEREIAFAPIAPGSVRVFRFAEPLGAGCRTDDECVSGHCVDGVCCDAACGGGDPADCQACSAAAGAARDGACQPLPATHTCRPGRGECDVPDRCDGANVSCPADVVSPNGASCASGVCLEGSCSGGDADPTARPEVGAEEAPSASSCAVRPAPARGRDVPVAVLALGLLAAVLAVRRRRCAARARATVAAGVSSFLLLTLGARTGAAATTWRDGATVTATAPQVNDAFGHAVAVHGDRAVVGAPGTSRAYVLERDGERWTTRAELSVPEPVPDVGSLLELYGAAVALDEQTIVVSAPDKQEVIAGTNPPSKRRLGGRVYVYTRSPAGAWTIAQTLKGDDTLYEDAFGASLALRGDLLVVGASDQPGIGRGAQPVPTFAGAAYVFRRTGGQFVQEQKLVALERRAGDSFGRSVAVDGGVVYVGASEDRGYVPGEPREDPTGAVYVFTKTAASWKQTARLVPAGAPAGSQVGTSVSVSDGTLVTGAPSADASRPGFAAVFRRAGAEWTFAQKLQPADMSELGDGFGTGVAVHGAQILVGRANLSSPSSASMHAFVGSGARWQERLAWTDKPNGFGRAIAFDGITAVVGAGVSGAESAYRGPGAASFFRHGTEDGGACAAGVVCLSGFCADGVCCDTACGDGAENDCQACSVAAGATRDGTCAPRKATAVCRPSTNDCDVADTCDGTSVTCPADAVAQNGAACNGDGVCAAGTCSVPPPGATGDEAPSSADDADDASGSCSASTSAPGSAWLLVVLGGVVTGLARRRARRPSR